MQENEYVELTAFAPEGFKRRIVDELSIELRSDDDTLEAELVTAAGELLERRIATERMGMRGADEASRIVALGLARFVVDKPCGFEIGSHARGAGEPGHVDAR